VAGHHRLDVKAEDVVAGCDPVADRPVPHDRMALVEQQVSGENDFVGGHMDDGVGLGVRGAEVGELHRLGPHL
jgi:hypothetical protein